MCGATAHRIEYLAAWFARIVFPKLHVYQHPPIKFGSKCSLGRLQPSCASLQVDCPTRGAACVEWHYTAGKLLGSRTGVLPSKSRCFRHKTGKMVKARGHRPWALDHTEPTLMSSSAPDGSFAYHWPLRTLPWVGAAFSEGLTIAK
jgi:hypothetical protein